MGGGGQGQNRAGQGWSRLLGLQRGDAVSWVQKQPPQGNCSTIPFPRACSPVPQQVQAGQRHPNQWQDLTPDSRPRALCPVRKPGFLGEGSSRGNSLRGAREGSRR